MAEAAVAIVAPGPGIDFILHAIGFIKKGDGINITIAGLAEYEDFHDLVDNDIRDMVEEIGKRTVANGRTIFGVGRVKKLIGVMHWIQDCYHTSGIPNHNDSDDQTLAQTRRRASIRQTEKDLVDADAKAANPSKFTQKTNGLGGRKRLQLPYMCVFPGSKGVPLAFL